MTADELGEFLIMAISEVSVACACAPMSEFKIRGRAVSNLNSGFER